MTVQAHAHAGHPARATEWATLALIGGCYALWAGALWLWPVAPLVAWAVLALACALHASLTHEVLHGHPFADRRRNEALMALPLSLAVPYRRFRDLHLAHHRDSRLTDPYDDPESNYHDPDVWARRPAWARMLWRINNTLAGRIAIGTLLGQAIFLRDEIRLLRARVPGIARAWGLHGAGVAAVAALVVRSDGPPLWAYVLAAYCGLSLIKIRTFLEHRAHADKAGRTVIIEDRGPLALLFLNNNLHAVHHSHPNVPWYALPALYRANRDRFVKANHGYVYRSYAQIFRRHLWRAKDPVPHPLWRRD
ncbi:MAG: fatty acid desaturase [Rhodobacteraceae bacterium]|nr:fatty acid desaturase [Paracoccaceae bacterium]